MLQSLPIALAQVKAGNTSQNLLNNIRKIMYSLCQEKEITKSIQQYNEFSKFIKQNEYCIFEFENSHASYSHRLLLHILNRINLKRRDKYVVSSNLSIYYTWKNIKKSYKKNKLKISAPT